MFRVKAGVPGIDGCTTPSPIQWSLSSHGGAASPGNAAFPVEECGETDRPAMAAGQSSILKSNPRMG